MMDERNPFPEKRDGRLFVPGLKEPLDRDRIRHIRANVTDLKVQRYFENVDGKTNPRFFALGLATLENCTIGIAGEKEVFRQLRMSCKPVHPDSPQYEWRVIVGFSEADWEIGNEDKWWMECWIPTPVFDEFTETYKAGNANTISLACTTDLWADSFVRHAPVSATIAWKIPVEKYGHGKGAGTIDAFSWELVPKSKEPVRKEDTQVYKAGQRFAEGLFDDARSTPVPAPPMTAAKKVHWGWWVLGAITVGLFLLFKNG
jgi:hypothetical protein